MAIDITKAISFVQAKWTNAQCNACGGTQHNIEQNVFQLLEFNGEGLSIGGPVYPVIPVTCTNCGHIRLLSGVVAGVTTK